PVRTMISENIRILPDGTFVLPDAGIKTGAIENETTGERITVSPTSGTGGFRITFAKAEHMLDGVSAQQLHQKLGRWVEGYSPGIVMVPLHEVFTMLGAHPRQPVSPTLFVTYILP